MAKTIELSCAIRNGQPSIQIHVTEVVEGNVKEKIQEMLNDLPGPIADSLKELHKPRLLSNEEVTVCDVPVQNRRASTSKTRSFKSAPNEKITERQLYCIKESLGKLNLDEKELCLEYGVDRLEDLPKNAAISIVSDIKNIEKNY